MVLFQYWILGYTSHPYWCPGGIGKNIYEQQLQIFGKYYVETDAELIPTGQILSVKDTPYDFTQPTALGTHIHNDFPAVQRNRGYDVSFVRQDREPGKDGRLYQPHDAICLEASGFPDAINHAH